MTCSDVSRYDFDIDIKGRARGSYGHVLADQIMAQLSYDFNRLGFKSLNSAPVATIDELSDPEVCKRFVESVERSGLSKQQTLDVERKVGVVKARLPNYYTTHQSDFAYNSLGLAPVGRTFQGILAKARRTLQRP